MAFVLIIEANETLAGRASDVLITAGHACGWVSNIDQAFALLRWRAPDLILLDQAMPGADGGALPGTLRRAAGSPGLQVIILTSGAASACPHSPRDSAVVDRISKPFDPRYLVWRVNHALEARAGRPLILGGGGESGDSWSALRAKDIKITARSLV